MAWWITQRMHHGTCVCSAGWTAVSVRFTPVRRNKSSRFLVKYTLRRLGFIFCMVWCWNAWCGNARCGNVVLPQLWMDWLKIANLILFSAGLFKRFWLHKFVKWRNKATLHCRQMIFYYYNNDNFCVILKHLCFLGHPGIKNSVTEFSCLWNFVWFMAGRHLTRYTRDISSAHGLT